MGAVLEARPIQDRGSRGGTSKSLPDGVSKPQSYVQKLNKDRTLVESYKAQRETLGAAS